MLAWTTLSVTTLGHVLDLVFAAGCKTGDSKCERDGKITKGIVEPHVRRLDDLLDCSKKTVYGFICYTGET